MNPSDAPFAPGAAAGSTSSSSVPSKAASATKMKPLADDFKPGQDDVICGRGKKCYNHIGNTRFRHRVIGMLDDYASAKSKLDKSGVLNRVMADVRRASPGGGFVKQDDNGNWYEVGDFLAREKTSQAFRDALHERYKSSNVSKKKRRQKELAMAPDKAQRLSRTEKEMTARLEKLSDELLRSASTDNHSSGNVSSSSSPQVVPQLQPNLDMMRRLSGLSSRQLASRSASLIDPRFPDPLFGRASVPNAAAGTSFPHGYSRGSGLSSADLLPPRAHSFSHPVQRPATSREEALHSSLPNMHLSDAHGTVAHDPLLVDVTRLNQSLPNLHPPTERANPVGTHASALPFNMESDQHQHLEPLPFHEDNLSPLTREKNDLRRQDPGANKNDQLADKDLLYCLSKLTEHSISDDNPYEPIPIAADIVKKNAQVKTEEESTISTNIFDEFMDEDNSAREFAEG